MGDDLMPPFLAPDGLPLWDTFEAFIFFAAGLTTGVVLGFLFPSLWRGFRRRLRPNSRFAISDSELNEATLVPSFLIEPPPLPSGTRARIPMAGSPTRGEAAVEIQLAKARAQFQSGHLRDSLTTYLTVLRSPQVSSAHTARLMNELAQVYAELGLLDRALACAKEYHLMRRSSPVAFRQRFELAHRAHDDREMVQSVKSFTGRLPASECLRLAHRLLDRAEDLLKLTRERGRVPTPFDALIEAARRLAPASLRLRHVQALRSFTDALRTSGEAEDQLWVALFAEIVKRATLHQEQGLPLSLGVEALVEAVALLSVAPHAIAGHAQAGPQIASMVGSCSPAVLKSCRWLGDFSISHCSAQPSFPSDTLLHEILRRAFPQSWETWERRLLRGPTAEPDDFCCTKALQIAMGSHSCASCKAMQIGHLWSCPSCGSLETLTPAFRMT
jgi:hypothetical protein